MMDSIMIVSSGLSLFEKVLRSCPPEATNGGESGKKYLSGLVQSVRQIKFKKFIEGLELENFELSIFGYLYKIAKKDGRIVIDEQFIAYFFGGEPHIKRVMEAMQWKDFSFTEDKLYPQKSLVSHVLLPGEVVEIREKWIDVVYRNDDFSILLSNLIPLEDVTDLKRGDRVLCHHSSVLSLASSRVESYLLDIQEKSLDFMNACNAIATKGIDHRNMISHPWAKRAGGICCL